ncbi:serine/threonine protein kinase [Nitzschia inconspicua]|uniref:Casein kinase I n=1 Tax=Nitzschia inconspicua TaxID=303405 RepID=A0A9K3M574_9STRA|nr:serine/threonine protein kinase [Nitzschia inconspicua]
MDSNQNAKHKLAERTPSDAAEDYVEGGSTLSGGELPSRNASPYSSTTDLRKQQQQQQQKHSAPPAAAGATTTPATSSLTKPTPPLPSNNNNKKSKTYHSSSDTASSMIYGAPILVHTTGNFPAVGSTLGPFFSIGKLGKGTFCSIHKCINLAYFHDRHNHKREEIIKPRLAAAKVEIGDFVNSGILGGEASILHFLHSVLEDHTVPVYMGHYHATESTGTALADGNNNVLERRQSKISNNKNMATAIVMEYLPGQDMHVIRDWATRQQQLQQQQQEQQQEEQQQSSSGGINRLRRVSVQDAVFLTANVMLPLLQRMHSVGIVHRDVKPSNVVKRAGTESSKDFCVVDFGLSKSIVVPQDSSLSDTQHVWQGKGWMKTAAINVPGDAPACYRKERESADFRGTSMYASVPVHQLKDYAPRDDIWSLMYVFCDLVSGGLPWMSHAATRDRVACQKIKQRIHGMEAQADGEIRTDTKRLLMGDEYHVAMYKKYKGGVDPPEVGDGEDDNVTIPQPLDLSNDTTKVQLLEKAFEHLKQLKFTDMPDYDLIRKCLEGFLDRDDTTQPSVAPIDWKALSTSFRSRVGMDNTMETGSPLINGQIPQWDFQENIDRDPLEWEDPNIFPEADYLLQNSPEEEKGGPLYGEAADLALLPLEMRFRTAQMDYNVSHQDTIEPHLALRDWLKVALPLLYGTWDSAKYEKGGHRINEDGYRRENYLRMVEKCIECASTFHGFRSKSCFYHCETFVESEPTPKRRKILSTMRSAPKSNGALGSDLITVSKVAFELRMTKRAEEILPRAPPPRLSFGS